MKQLVKILSIITIMATLGACASQMGCGSEREYRNPYLRAKRIAAPADSTDGGRSSCSAQQQSAQ